jgi:hypothetical protein
MDYTMHLIVTLIVLAALVALVATDDTKSHE